MVKTPISPGFLINRDAAIVRLRKIQEILTYIPFAIHKSFSKFAPLIKGNIFDGKKVVAVVRH
jgi:hypothetical protein